MFTQVSIYKMPHVRGHQRYFRDVSDALSFYQSIGPDEGYIGTYECNYDKPNHDPYSRSFSGLRLEVPTPWSRDMLEASYAIVQPVDSGKVPEFFYITNANVKNDRVVFYDIAMDYWTTYSGHWTMTEALVSQTNKPVSSIQNMPEQPLLCAWRSPKVTTTPIAGHGIVVAWGVSNEKKPRGVILKVIGDRTDPTGEGLIPAELQNGYWVSSFFGTLENCYGVVWLPAPSDIVRFAAELKVVRYDGEELFTDYEPITQHNQVVEGYVNITQPYDVYDIEPYSYYSLNTITGAYSIPGRALFGERQLKWSVDFTGSPPVMLVYPASMSPLQADAIGALVKIEGIPVSMQNSQLNEFVNNGGIWKSLSSAVVSGAIGGGKGGAVGAIGTAGTQVGLDIFGAAVSPNIYQGGRVAGLLAAETTLALTKTSADTSALATARRAFSIMGYNVLEVQAPLKDGLNGHLVVKTLNDCVKGQVPQPILDLMNNEMRSGMTWWSPNAKYMDYGGDN